MILDNLTVYNVIIDEKYNFVDVDDSLLSVLIDKENFLQNIYQKDSRVFAGVLQSMKKENEKKFQKFNFRLVKEDNSLIHVFCMSNYFNGFFLLNIIIEEKIDEIIVQKTQFDEYSKAIFSIYNDLSFVYDTQNKMIIRVSNGDVVLFDGNLINSKAIERSIKEHIAYDDLKIFDEMLIKMEKGKPNFHYELRIKKSKTDNYEWYEVEGKTIYENAIPRFTVGIVKNIDEEKNERENYQNTIALDPMTLLLNKTAITQYAKEKLAERITESNPKPLILMIIDIDNFKNINDSYGHSFGDSVIMEIAKMLKEKVSNIGAVGRIGGDEFMVIIDKNDEVNELPIICKSICYGFENVTREDVVGFKVSCTMGVACYPKDSAVYEDLFLMADKTLYRGKKKGKNCYVIYDVTKHGSIDGNSLLNNYEINVAEHKISSNLFISQTIIELNNSKNINNCLLSCLTRFALDQVRISLHDNEGYKVLYQVFCNGRKNSYQKKVKYAKSRAKILKLFDDEGLNVCSRALDYEENDPEIFDAFFKSNDVRAFLATSLKLPNDQLAVISFEMCTKKRLWSNEEIEALSIIGRYVCNYISHK